MPYEKLHEEVQQLKDSSDRLRLLADELPPFTEALLSISAEVLRTAIILEVLLVSRSSPS